jgi:hypothetical protein
VDRITVLHGLAKDSFFFFKTAIALGDVCFLYRMVCVVLVVGLV